jgi:DNA-binding HxlR family transcriptional regulator
MKHKEDAAPFSYEGLDRVIHERARLGLLTSLTSRPEGLTFVDLKRLCDLTDGNLSRHLQVLEREGFVEVSKGHEGNRPQTLCKMTKMGRQRFLEYISTLEQVVKDAARATKRAGAGDRSRELAPKPA